MNYCTSSMFEPYSSSDIIAETTGPIMYMGSNIDEDIINCDRGSEIEMPFTLQTIIKKIEEIPNTVNRNLVSQFHDYMVERDLSKNHQINNLKVIISFANYIGPETSFHQICKKDQILAHEDP